jgi:hypothetical protein
MSGRSALFAGLAVLLAAGMLRAQPWSGAAGLEVRASGRDGEIAGAVVRLTYRSRALEESPAPVATDGNGRATLTGLAAGTWQAEISHPEYMTFVAVVELAGDDKPVVTASFLEATAASTSSMKVRFGKARGAASPPLRLAAAERPHPAEPGAAPSPGDGVPESSDRPTEPILAPPVIGEDAPSPEQTPPAPTPAEAPQAPTPAPETPAPTAEPEAPTPAEKPETPAPAPETPTPPAGAEAPTPAETPHAPAPPPEAPAPPVGVPPVEVPAPGPASPTPPLPDAAEGEPVAVESVPARAAGPATPPLAAPAAEALRSYSRRTCFECRPGEWAVTERVLGGGGEICRDGDLDAFAAVMGAVAESDELELQGYAGPLAGARALLTSDATAALDAALSTLPGGCSLAAVVLPRNARFSAFQYEASAGGPPVPCLPDQPCEGSAARWSGPPRLERGANSTVAYGLFGSAAPAAGYLTVYFSPATPGWEPGEGR